MSQTIFSDFPTVQFEGENSKSSLAYRFYDAQKIVLGKPLGDQLRLSVGYWHSLAMNGSDPFGGPSISRPWFGGESMEAAKQKADAAFDLFRVLDLPFYAFHDRDIAPEGDSLRESLANFHTMTDYMGAKMQHHTTKLLWGAANLFSHPRFVAGASTNADPEVFA